MSPPPTYLTIIEKIKMKKNMEWQKSRWNKFCLSLLPGKLYFLHINDGMQRKTIPWHCYCSLNLYQIHMEILLPRKLNKNKHLCDVVKTFLWLSGNTFVRNSHMRMLTSYTLILCGINFLYVNLRDIDIFLLFL